ncbi:MAG: fibronectin type III domain-containing protein [candidate division WOR-3 bacterium]|uniref:Fibronectin type-III domain-containing protein n=1 Tax=candidate division WOR-3 bacterium TaxID=2052148 RepID=A0A7C3EG22_UNCW3|nr:fibronectin type III domain-containing protein [candidate division WOR-3 bacterium]
MKRLLPILTILAWIVLGVVSIGSDCSSIVGGAPTGLQVTADTDSTVKITWNAPAEGTPDKYIVYFQETGTSGYTTIANNITTTQFVHNPNGKTGTYKVAAMFGSQEYQSLTTVSTVPVATSALTVAELNAAGNSGYGWNRTSGAGATYSMTQAANAANVDFYITDFQTTTYSIASPDQGPTDPGNVVPAGSWRVNGIAGPLTAENAPLPAHSNTVYFNYQDITQTPFLAGIYTQDGYYALAKLDGFNAGDKTYQVSGWFQLIKGLRLIQH